MMAPGTVQHQVVDKFWPNREGDWDYSGLLTSYLNRIRHGK